MSWFNQAVAELGMFKIIVSIGVFALLIYGLSAKGAGRTTKGADSSNVSKEKTETKE